MATTEQASWVDRVLGVRVGALASTGTDTLPTAREMTARPDADTLVKELSALARRIPELPPTADAAIKARLVKLATDANVNIKTNNLNYAADFVGQLRAALRDALDTAGVGVGQVVPPTRADGGK